MTKKKPKKLTEAEQAAKAAELEAMLEERARLARITSYKRKRAFWIRLAVGVVLAFLAFSFFQANPDPWQYEKTPTIEQISGY